LPKLEKLCLPPVGDVLALPNVGKYPLAPPLCGTILLTSGSVLPSIFSYLHNMAHGLLSFGVQYESYYLNVDENLLVVSCLVDGGRYRNRLL
ncbi:hypothetical protein AVEN_41312-1, partial [Araneus ventricosus]